jgi:lysyl-tRNA synthetase class I
VPEDAAGLLAEQGRYLVALADAAAAERPGAGDAWQDLIFRTAEATGLASGQAFGAIYLAFLGRPNGPRAGWLLASLGPAFVDERLRAAAAAAGEAGAEVETDAQAGTPA